MFDNGVKANDGSSRSVLYMCEDMTSEGGISSLAKCRATSIELGTKYVFRRELSPLPMNRSRYVRLSLKSLEQGYACAAVTAITSRLHIR